MKLTSSLAAAVIASLAFTTSTIHASTFTWSGTATGTYQWASGTNWNATPVSNLDTILNYSSALSSAAAIISNNDVASPPFKLNRLNFTNSGSGTAATLTLTGVQLEFVTNTASATPTLVFNTSGTKPTIEIQNNLLLTNNLGVTATTDGKISGVISGGGSLTKTGGGTLTLTAANDFSGGLILNGGTVSVGTASVDSLGAVNGVVTVNSASGLSITGANFSATTLAKSFVLNANLALSGSTGVTITGAVSGTGNITPIASGNVTARMVTLASTSNTFTGAINSVAAGNNSGVTVNSLADATVTPGSGNIFIGNGGSNGLFAWGSGAVSSLTLNNRQIVMSGTTGTAIVSNSNATAANIVTINSNLGVSAAGAKTLQLGGANTGANLFAGKIEDGVTGGASVISINKADAGTWILSGANTYTGTTTVSNGTLVARSASALGTGGAANVSITAGKNLSYVAASDTALNIGGTLTINGGTGTTLGASIGSTATSAQVNVAGNALVPTAAVSLNVYGVSGASRPAGTTKYTLISGGSGGATTLNNGTYTLGSVFNNTDFTVSNITKSTSDVFIDVTKASALTSSAYFKANGYSTLGTTWAASNGSSLSNWSTSSGGVVQALVAGPTTDVIVDDNSVATSTVLGADMSIKGLTISDNTNNFALNAGYSLTIGTHGITKNNTTTKTATIVPNLVLGGNQSWSNSDTGNALVVSGNVTGANDLTVTGAGNTTLSGSLQTGTGTLTKSGAGALTLTGANSFSGGLILNGGTVNSGTGTSPIDALGAAGGVVTVQSASTLVMAGGTFAATTLNKSFVLNANLTFGVNGNSGNGANITGDVSGTGSILFGSTGNTGLRPVTLAGLNNTFTGAIVGNQNSNITVNSLSDAVGSGNISLGANGGPSLFTWGIGAVSSLTLNNRQIVMSGPAGQGGVINNANGNAGNIVTISSNLSVTGAGAKTLTLGGANTGANLFAGTIANGSGSAISLTKANAGQWIVSGENTYTGVTTVSGGTLTLGNSLALQNSVLDTSNSIAGTGTAGLKTTVATLTMGGLTGNKNLASIFTTALGGTGGATALGGYSGVTALTLNPGTGVTHTYDGIIADGAAGMTLTMSGAGTQTLDNVNTYSGATLISGGTLALGTGGSIDNTSEISLGTVGTFDVTAKSGGYTVGILRGSGNVTGALSVSSQLAIGNSPGTTNFSSDLTLGAGSTYLYDLTGGVVPGAADLGDVAGALTINAGAILDLVQLGTYTANNKFTLFAYDGTFIGTFKDTSSHVLADGATFTDAGGIWMIDYNDTTAGANGGVSASNTYITITAVPEPNAALLVGGLSMLALLRRRRN